MKVTSSSISTSKSVAEVWTKLLNWVDWPRWDGGMETIEFGGPLQLGAIGRLKLKDGPTVNLAITEYTFRKSYTSEFKLLGTRYVFIHYIESDVEQTKVVVDVESDGVTNFIFGNLLKAKLTTALPDWMNNFKRQLEDESISRS